MSRPLAVLEGTDVEMLEGAPKSKSTGSGESCAAQLGSDSTDGMQQSSVAAQWVPPAAAQQRSEKREKEKEGGKTGEHLKNLPWLVEKGERKESRQRRTRTGSDRQRRDQDLFEFSICFLGRLERGALGQL